jgi:YVTN family beta-propeller protein
MLRVSPDGSVVWVQTAVTANNVVLDAGSMQILKSVFAGEDPEQSAFQPNGGAYGLIAHIDSTALYVLDAKTGESVKTIELGEAQGNICFSPDGGTAFVTSFDGNEVVVVDMTKLAVAGRIPTGREPQGLVLLNPYIAS